MYKNNTCSVIKKIYDTGFVRCSNTIRTPTFLSLLNILLLLVFRQVSIWLLLRVLILIAITLHHKCKQVRQKTYQSSKYWSIPLQLELLLSWQFWLFDLRMNPTQSTNEEMMRTDTNRQCDVVSTQWWRLVGHILHSLWDQIAYVAMEWVIWRW